MQGDDARCRASLLPPVLFSSVFIHAEMFVDGKQSRHSPTAAFYSSKTHGLYFYSAERCISCQQQLPPRVPPISTLLNPFSPRSLPQLPTQLTEWQRTHRRRSIDLLR